MSESAKLTAEQSKIVRELQQAVEAFDKASAFVPEALRTHHRAVASKFREMEAAFPEAAQEAAEYYQSDLPEEPEEKAGYEDALFSVLLSLQAFYDAESLSRVVSALNSLHGDIYNLATFSDEYNVSRGFWESDVLVPLYGRVYGQELPGER